MDNSDYACGLASEGLVECWAFGLNTGLEKTYEPPPS